MKDNGQTVVSSKDPVHCYHLYLGCSTEYNFMDLKKLIADCPQVSLVRGDVITY